MVLIKYVLRVPIWKNTVSSLMPLILTVIYLM